MVKLVDTRDLKSLDLTVVPVRFRLRAPIKINDLEESAQSLILRRESDSRRIIDARKSPSQALEGVNYAC